MVGSSDVVVRGATISTENTSESYKGRKLNKPCNQWARNGHMLAQEPVECQMHLSHLAFEIVSCRLLLRLSMGHAEWSPRTLPSQATAHKGL